MIQIHKLKGNYHCSYERGDRFCSECNKWIEHIIGMEFRCVDCNTILRRRAHCRYNK